jgi:hypothetical protein
MQQVSKNMPSWRLEPSNIIVASVSRMLSNLQPTYDKLLKRGKIPDSADISKISPLYFASVIDLHQTVFNDIEPSEVILRLSGHSGIVNYCKQTSTLLLLGDEIVGVTLVLSKKNYSLAYIYAVIVKSRWQRTWVTAYLKYHSLVRLLSFGIDEIAFQALAGNRDTLKHAKKVGAKIVGDNYVWSE